ncbi:piezo-type mechanosensitive ion channel component [Drosophila mauritiana]|uniref:Piezo-type mechanosensitive ion channel component n=1 Tax=Drosophila mauritiana TaxID=7226 RepID=A0A6P8KEP4_DROMA|nr:piezo-type mechanosensitive ion channel component [Drosophila mauritiana]
MEVSLVRPVGLSYLYLLTFFLSPWLLQSNSLKQRTFLNVFIIFLCVLSTFGIVGHIIFNLINLFFVDLSSKNSFSFILRQFGFLYFKGLSFVSIAHWILPDIIVLLNTVAFFIFSEIKYKREKNSIQNGDDVFYKKSKELKGALKVAEINRVLIIVYIRSVLKTSLIFSLIVLYFAATLRPSLPGSLYFCMFIIAGSYWALFRQRKMYYSVIFMIVVLLVHITCIFAYQLPVLQNTINGDKLWTRLMGMEVLIRLYKDNRNGKILELNAQLNLDSYLSPIALMLAYFATTLSLINRSQYEISFNTIRMNLGHKSNSIYANIQPSNEENEEISIFTEPSMLEQLFYIVCELSSFVYKNSYILLNIIMMVCNLFNFIYSLLKHQVILRFQCLSHT